MSQPPQGGIPERPANIPVGAISASDIGLPDGGVPPQICRTNAVLFNPISLPDGGIPPQVAPQAVAVPQPQGQVPISTMDNSLHWARRMRWPDCHVIRDPQTKTLGKKASPWIQSRV